MLEVVVDKFTFRVPEDLWYSDAGVWVKAEGCRARLGLSDFTQQVNGDIAFVNVAPAGTGMIEVPDPGCSDCVKVAV